MTSTRNKGATRAAGRAPTKTKQVKAARLQPGALSAKARPAAILAPLAYSMGTGAHDAQPVQRKAGTFADFAAYCLREKGRSTAKGGRWVCGPLDKRIVNTNGNWRIAAAALPREWCALDVDGCDPADFDALQEWARQWAGFMYATARDAPNSRRARIVWQLAAPVDRAQGVAHGVWVREQVARVAPSALAKWDKSTFRGEQPIYLPLANAESAVWLDAPAMPAQVGTTAAPASKDEDAPDDDDDPDALVDPTYAYTPKLEADLREALAVVPCHRPDYADFGNALKALPWKGEHAAKRFDIYHEWAREGATYQGEADVRKTWAGLHPTGEKSVASIFYRANKLREAAEAEEDDEDDLLQGVPKLPDAALYGVLRPVVEAATRHSEATKVGVAVALLIEFAARFGGALRLRIGDDDRTLPLFVLLVGPSGRGRKGTAAQFPRKLFEDVDDLLAPDPEDEDPQLLPPAPQRTTGVASGVGIIEAVRDEGEKLMAAGPRVLPAAPDKRLLIDLSEFVTVFAASANENNTLSPVLRDAFDGRTLANTAVTNPLRATGAHVCAFGHITMHEFRKHTIESKRNTDISNGLLNRFCIVYSVRDKKVSRPLPVPDMDRFDLAVDIARNVRKVFRGAGNVGPNDRRRIEYKRTSGAQRLWDAAYNAQPDRYASPVLDALMSRWELNVSALAVLLAAINGERQVTEPALRAALAWGQYMVDSTSKVFASAGERRKARELHRDIERITEWARSKKDGTFAKGDLTRALHKSIDSTRRDAALQAMLDGAPAQLVRDGTRYRLVAGGAPAVVP